MNSQYAAVDGRCVSCEGGKGEEIIPYSLLWDKTAVIQWLGHQMGFRWPFSVPGRKQEKFSVYLSRILNWSSFYISRTPVWEEQQRELRTKTDGPLHLSKWAFSHFPTGKLHVLKVSRFCMWQMSCPISWALTKGRSTLVPAWPDTASLGWHNPWKLACENVCFITRRNREKAGNIFHSWITIDLEAFEKAGVLSERDEPLGAQISSVEWRKCRYFIYSMRKLSL